MDSQCAHTACNGLRLSQQFALPGPRLKDAVEDALVVVILTRAPCVQRICDEAQHHLDALRLAQVQLEPLPQRMHLLRPDSPSVRNAPHGT